MNGNINELLVTKSEAKEMVKQLRAQNKKIRQLRSEVVVMLASNGRMKTKTQRIVQSLNKLITDKMLLNQTQGVEEMSKALAENRLLLKDLTKRGEEFEEVFNDLNKTLDKFKSDEQEFRDIIRNSN